MATPKKKSKASSAKSWKGKGEGAVDLLLPSENICRAKRPGMQAMLLEGKVPNALMPIIDEAMRSSQGGKPYTPDDQMLKEMMNDTEKMAAVVEFQRVVVMSAVLEPKILPVPEGEEDRDEDELYIDDIDPIDIAFIFQWAVGGAADLEKFRGGLTEAMVSLDSGKEMVDSA